MSQSKSPLSKKEIHPLIHGPFSSCTYKYMYTYYQKIHHFYDRLDLRYHHSNHIKYSPKPAGVAPRFPMACDKTRKEATTIPECATWLGRSGWLKIRPVKLCNGFNVWRIFIHQHVPQNRRTQGNPQRKSKSRPWFWIFLLTMYRKCNCFGFLGSFPPHITVVLFASGGIIPTFTVSGWPWHACDDPSIHHIKRIHCLQGGPLLATSGVITPINGLINRQLGLRPR